MKLTFQMYPEHSEACPATDPIIAHCIVIIKLCNSSGLGKVDLIEKALIKSMLIF